MGELWKDIEGYKGLYQVSNLGRVKRVTSGRILKPLKHPQGYLRVRLSKNGIAFTKTIHRLVAETFIPNQENKPEINHIDEDKTNNSINNLEWSTRKDNLNHGTHNERMSKTKSISIIATNINTDESQEFYGINECARKLEIQAPNITNVLKGRRKQACGFTFKYKEENR